MACVLSFIVHTERVSITISFWQGCPTVEGSRTPHRGRRECRGAGAGAKGAGTGAGRVRRRAGESARVMYKSRLCGCSLRRLSCVLLCRATKVTFMRRGRAHRAAAESPAARRAVARAAAADRAEGAARAHGAESVLVGGAAHAEQLRFRRSWPCTRLGLCAGRVATSEE